MAGAKLRGRYPATFRQVTVINATGEQMMQVQDWPINRTIAQIKDVIRAEKDIRSSFRLFLGDIESDLRDTCTLLDRNLTEEDSPELLLIASIENCVMVVVRNAASLRSRRESL